MVLGCRGLGEDTLSGGALQYLLEGQMYQNAMVELQ